MQETEVINSRNQRCLIAADHIIFDLKGKIEVEDLRQVLNAADKHIANFEGSHSLYVDVTQLKEVSIHSRRVGVDWIKQNISRLRIAVYTSTVFMFYFVNMIIAGTGAGKRMRIFKSKEEALAWLRSY